MIRHVLSARVLGLVVAAVALSCAAPMAQVTVSPGFDEALRFVQGVLSGAWAPPADDAGAGAGTVGGGGS